METAACRLRYRASCRPLGVDTGLASRAIGRAAAAAAAATPMPSMLLTPPKVLEHADRAHRAGERAPLARLGATATALHEREVVLFGGSHGGVRARASTCSPSSSADLGSSEAFLRVGQPATSGAPPGGSFNHCACLLGLTDIAIFGGGGGADGRTPLCSVGLLDTTLDALGGSRVPWRAPAPRNAASAPSSGRSAGCGCLGGALRAMRGRTMMSTRSTSVGES